MTDAETAELQRLRDEIELANTRNLLASCVEASKFQAQMRWYPWVLMGLAALSILAIATVAVFKIIHG